MFSRYFFHRPITPWSAFSIGDKLNNIGPAATNAASAVYPSPNLAIFFPFYTNSNVYINTAMTDNGSPVSGSVDIGVYSWSRTKLFSTGPTLLAGVNTTQTFSLTGTIPVGHYWLAISADNGGSQLVAASAGGLAGLAYDVLCGFYQQANAFPLPAQATLSVPSFDYIPVFGITPRSF